MVAPIVWQTATIQILKKAGRPSERLVSHENCRFSKPMGHECVHIQKITEASGTEEAEADAEYDNALREAIKGVQDAVTIINEHLEEVRYEIAALEDCSWWTLWFSFLDSCNVIVGLFSFAKSNASARCTNAIHWFSVILWIKKALNILWYIHKFQLGFYRFTCLDWKMLVVSFYCLQFLWTAFYFSFKLL